MDWYYAENNEQRGPVTEAEIRALIAANKITRETRVWNSTLSDWRSAASAGLFSETEAPPLPNTRTCIVTGKSFPTSQMIETEHGWVSAEGRDVYYQCLREGVPFPAAAGVTNARADGKKIVIPIADARLPLRCVKTNQPVTEAELKKKTLYWCHPLVLLSFLLNILIMLILYLIFRKPVKLEIPISKAGRRTVTLNACIGGTIFVVGLVLMFVGFANLDSSLGSFIALGLILLLWGLFWSGRRGSILRVVKYKHGEAWLAGAHPDFVAALPPYGK